MFLAILYLTVGVVQDGKEKADMNDKNDK